MFNPFRKKYVRKSLSNPIVKKEIIAPKKKMIRAAILWVVLVVTYSMWWLQSMAHGLVGFGGQLVWYTMGDSMREGKENINILLVGYGWGVHDGAALADTIIVASYAPDSHSVSMLAIPRDLIVVTHDKQTGKINSVLSKAYNKNWWDIRAAAWTLSQAVEKITWLTIPYYAMIDFDGFVKIVDSLGGIDIDVPQHFLDMEYPVDRNGTYEIFELPAWLNHLSGPNTLRYARSRHSTSDFSRSKRQQTIIKAIVSKLMSSENFSISKFKELYAHYTSIVKTNITLDQMVGLLQYDTSVPAMHSFGYTMQCSNDIWKFMIAGCLLRQANGGILPALSAEGEIEAYADMQYFAQIVTKDQWFLAEASPLTIYNASDKDLASTLAHGDKIASKVAAKLNRYAFNIIQATNAPSVSTGTFIEVYGTWSYTNTIELLKKFVYVNEVKIMTGDVDTLGNPMTGGLYLYLGNNYLNAVGNTEFDYY